MLNSIIVKRILIFIIVSFQSFDFVKATENSTITTSIPETTAAATTQTTTSESVTATATPSPYEAAEGNSGDERDDDYDNENQTDYIPDKYDGDLDTPAQPANETTSENGSWDTPAQSANETSIEDESWDTMESETEMEDKMDGEKTDPKESKSSQSNSLQHNSEDSGKDMADPFNDAELEKLPQKPSAEPVTPATPSQVPLGPAPLSDEEISSLPSKPVAPSTASPDSSYINPEHTDSLVGSLPSSSSGIQNPQNEILNDKELEAIPPKTPNMEDDNKATDYINSEMSTTPNVPLPVQAPPVNSDSSISKTDPAPPSDFDSSSSTNQPYAHPQMPIQNPKPELPPTLPDEYSGKAVNSGENVKEEGSPIQDDSSKSEKEEYLKAEPAITDSKEENVKIDETPIQYDSKTSKEESSSKAETAPPALDKEEESLSPNATDSKNLADSSIASDQTNSKDYLPASETEQGVNPSESSESTPISSPNETVGAQTAAESSSQKVSTKIIVSLILALFLSSM